MICNNELFDELRSLYPHAYILGCSTAGEICESQVFNNILLATAVFFEKTVIRFAAFELVGKKEYLTMTITTFDED